MGSTGIVSTGEIQHRLRGYCTVINRAIDGVPVAGSHAWAQFNINDDVVAEQVWWPELPASVRADVAALRAMLGDPTALADYRSKLPTAIAGQDPQVVIHHTDAFAAFAVSVTADFTSADKKSILSFRLDGAPAQFAHGPAGIESAK
jgi:hypothetical protein